MTKTIYKNNNSLMFELNYTQFEFLLIRDTFVGNIILYDPLCCD